MKLGRKVQLAALLLVASTILMLVDANLSGWIEVAGFAVTAGAIIWTWHKLQLHSYFFD